MGDLSTGEMRQTVGVGPLEHLRGLAKAGELASAIKHLRASTRKFRKPAEKNSMPAAALHRTIVALREVLNELPNSKAKAMPIDDVDKLAMIAILECASPQCTVCNGRATTTLANGVVIDCGECNASGFRRYEDKDRKRIMGRWLTNAENKLLEVAKSLYLLHDARGEAVAGEMIYGDED